MRTDTSGIVLPDARGLRFAVVVSRFNGDITRRLRDGAEAALRKAGADEAVEVFEVPGAFELPFAARAIATERKVDAVVCLGCLVRGETPHFEYIASAVAHGLMAVQTGTGVPVAFGVLTVNALAEAEARALPDETNKGFEAAAAAIEMARFARRVTARPPVGWRA
jgi:6,7-dimethyl-8-ribityllumazine synthase